MNVHEYSQQKKIDKALLYSIGWRDTEMYGEQCIRILYYTPDRKVAAVKYRMSKTNHPSGFVWRKGDKPLPYGLWYNGDGHQLLLCEGETDAITLWAHHMYAIGIPGAAAWRGEWWRLLSHEGWPVLLQDSDSAGAGLARVIASTIGTLRVASMLPFKDVNDAYLALENGFKEWVKKRIETALPLVMKVVSRSEEEHKDIGDIMGYLEQKGVTLRKAGSQWRAHCPLGTHADRNTPSFYVHPERGFYCFGCSASGGLRTLERLMEGR